MIPKSTSSVIDVNGDSKIIPEKLNSLAKSTAIAVPSDSPYKIISLSFILFKLSQYFTALASLYNPFSLGFPSFPLKPLYAKIK